MMAAKDRLESIKKIIQIEKKVAVSELSGLFSVTEETIRRDLEKLESEGILNRTFGGAVLNIENQREGMHFYQRATINLTEKRKMATLFENVLENKTTIIADASTSVREVVKLLNNTKDITLLTTSTVILNEMACTDINIISTGGIFDKSTLSLQGKIARDTIKKYHVDIALISCKGINLAKGIMDSKESEADVKKAMIEQADKIALFVDHSKFNKTAFVHLADWDNIDYLVTDCKPDEKWIEFCKENNIQLIF